MVVLLPIIIFIITHYYFCYYIIITLFLRYYYYCKGRRPRGVGINCLVALEREAWRNESGTVIMSSLLPKRDVIA